MKFAQDAIKMDIELVTVTLYSVAYAKKLATVTTNAAKTVNEEYIL